MDQLSQIDLAFCVDVTTSMTALLEAARRRMFEILTAVQQGAGAQLRVGVVSYHDYGQGKHPVHPHPFRDDPLAMRRVLAGLRIVRNAHNSDAAEAVLAGLITCVDELQWRPHAARVIILVGDAPPHACGANGTSYPDRFSEADPSGETLMGMSARVESALITLHALGMLPSVIPAHDGLTEECFSFLARTTGGTYRTARSSADALAVVREIGQREFVQLDLDRRLWSHLSTQDATDAPARMDELLPELEKRMGVPLHQLHSGVARLRKRGLLPRKGS
jgi:hypothetical protein